MRGEESTNNKSNSDFQVETESDNQNEPSLKTQLLQNIQKYLALEAKEKSRDERDKKRSPEKEEGEVSDIEVEEVELSDLGDEVTNIVHHEVSEPDNDYYNKYYRLKRDRAGPYSLPSPCYSKYMEQNKPSQTTVPETPPTPIIQPAPPT